MPRRACSLIAPDATEPDELLDFAEGAAAKRGGACLGEEGIGLRVFGVEDPAQEGETGATVVVCPGARARSVSAWLQQLLPDARVLMARAGKGRAARFEREAIAVDPDDEVASSPMALAHAITRLIARRGQGMR